MKVKTRPNLFCRKKTSLLQIRTNPLSYHTCQSDLNWPNEPWTVRVDINASRIKSGRTWHNGNGLLEQQTMFVVYLSVGWSWPRPGRVFRVQNDEDIEVAEALSGRGYSLSSCRTHWKYFRACTMHGCWDKCHLKNNLVIFFDDFTPRCTFFTLVQTWSPQWNREGWPPALFRKDGFYPYRENGFTAEVILCLFGYR